MRPPQKKPKRKGPLDSDQNLDQSETETRPSPSKKGRLVGTPADPNKLQASQYPSPNIKRKKKRVSFPQTPPQNTSDAPKTPATPATAEQLGLGSDLAKQLLKNGSGLISLTSMIMEAGKMMVEQGIPATDGEYRSMLAELVKIMVTPS